MGAEASTGARNAVDLNHDGKSDLFWYNVETGILQGGADERGSDAQVRELLTRVALFGMDDPRLWRFQWRRQNRRILVQPNDR